MKFGKLKSMAEREFGSEAVTFKWYPKYSIEAHVKTGDEQNCARLCAYSGEIVWGSAATTHLGWKEDEAAKKFAAYTLVTDGIIRYLCATIGPRSTLRAYADLTTLESLLLIYGKLLEHSLVPFNRSGKLAV